MHAKKLLQRAVSSALSFRKLSRQIRNTTQPIEALERRQLFSWTGATSGSANDAAHDYHNLSNWSNGVIDDSFANVAFSSDTTIYFSADRTVGGTGLNLNYSGEDLAFAATGASTRTLTVNGDAISFQSLVTVPAQHSLTVGSATPLDGSTTILMAGGSLESVSQASPLTNTIYSLAGTSSKIHVAAGNLRIDGSLRGAGTLTRTGSSSLWLNGDNSGFGGTFVTANGRTRFLSPNSGSAAAAWVFNVANANTLDFSNGSIAFGSLSGSSPLGLNLGAGAANNTIVIGGNNQNSSYSGSITDGGSSAKVNLTKVGTGTLTLTGANTVAGSLTVSGGTVATSQSQRFSSVSVGSSGTYLMSGASSGLEAALVSVSGQFQHSAGAVSTGQININSGGQFTDAGGTISNSSGVTINNLGTFKAAFDGSLAGTTGTFTHSGHFIEDVGAGNTNTVGMTFTNAVASTFNLVSGTANLSGFTSSSYATLQIDGTAGTLRLPQLQQYSQFAITGGILTVDNGVELRVNASMSGGTFNAGGIGFGWFTPYQFTFTQTGGTINAGSLNVGQNSAGATWNQTGGANYIDELHVSPYSQSPSTYNLSSGSVTANQFRVGFGGPAVFNLSGNGQLTATNEYIGSWGGTGTLNQTGGSNNVGSLRVGDVLDGTGYYNLSSGTLNAVEEYVGLGNWQPGFVRGSFTQSGGSNTISNALTLSYGGNSSGTYQKNGGSLTVPWLSVGYGDSATFSQTAGQTTVSQSLSVGQLGGTMSTLNLSGGSIGVAGNVHVGLSSPATLNQSGGTLQITQGLYVSGSGVDGENPNGHGTFVLSGAGQLSDLYTFVGYSANGSFTQSGGAHTTKFIVKNGPSGTVGTYTKTGGTLAAPTGQPPVQVIDVLKPSSSGNALVDEGNLHTLNLAATSTVGNNAISSWAINWGDGTNSSAPGSAATTSHIYTSGGVVRTINATATGGGKNYPSAPVNVLVRNIGPEIDAVAPLATRVGQEIVLETAFWEPGTGQTHVAQIDWGDGTIDSSQSGDFNLTESGQNGDLSAAHTYSQHGNYVAILTVVDSLGASSTIRVAVKVAYVAPTFGLAVDPQPAIAGEPVTLTMTADGTEAASVTQWEVDWGDGQTTVYTDPPTTTSADDATWTQQHTYSTFGNYTIHARATDANGQQDPVTLQINVGKAAGSSTATMTWSHGQGPFYYGNEQTTLTVSDLVPGHQYTIQLGVDFIGTWDGSNASGGYGPDQITVKHGNETLIDGTWTNFAGVPQTLTAADLEKLKVTFTATGSNEVFTFQSALHVAAPGSEFDYFSEHQLEDEYWNASASITDDGSAPNRFQASFKFGYDNAAVKSGYIQDIGNPYQLGSSGYEFGWINPSNGAAMKAGASYDQDKGNPSLLDSSVDSHNGSTPTSWQVKVPNGTYYVKLVAGDPRISSATYKYAVEGTSNFLNGTATSNKRWVTSDGYVTVSDEHLTIANVSGATAHKLAYVEITDAAAMLRRSVNAPMDVTALPSSSTKIDVRWRDNSDNETAFRIDRATSATGPWQQVGTTAANAGLYSDTVSASSTYFYRVVAIKDDLVANRLSGPVTTPSSNGQAPYNASRSNWSTNTRIDAENFDSGGKGVSFNDIFDGNAGGYYRASNVDVGFNIPENRYFVGWTRDTEWMEYTVDVPEAGTYVLEASVASLGDGGTLAIAIDGSDTNSNIDIPDTKGFTKYQTMTSEPFTISANGPKVLKLTAIDTGVSPYYVGDVDWIKLKKVEASAIQLSVNVPNESEANLLWNDPFTNETGYALQQSTDGVHFTTVQVAPANATGWSVKNLSASTNYQFRVVARFDDPSDSGVSNVASGQTHSVGTGTGWESLGTVLVPNHYDNNTQPAPRFFSASVTPNDEYRVRYVNGGAVYAGSTDTAYANWTAQGYVVDGDDEIVENLPYLHGDGMTISQFEASVAAQGGLGSSILTPTSTTLGVRFGDPDYRDNDRHADGTLNSGYSPGVTWSLERRNGDPDPSTLPRVSIQATTTDAYESPTGNQSDALVYTISLDAPADEALTVQLHPYAGTAAADDYDYWNSPSSVSFAPNETSKTIYVYANYDGQAETNETVSVCLEASTDYRLSNAFFATGTIHDEGDTNPVVTPPQNLRAAVAGPKQVNLDWDDAVSVGTTFNVYRGTKSDFRPSSSNRLTLTPIDSSQFVDQTIRSEGTYYYKATSVLNGVESSAASTIGQITSATPLVPEPPLSAHKIWIQAENNGKGAVSVTWTDSSLAEQGFSIARTDGDGSTKNFVVGPNVVSFLDNGPFENSANFSPTTLPTYTVASYNSGGTSSRTIAAADASGSQRVSIAASDATAVEGAPGDSITFTVSRTGATNQPLTVNLMAPGGTATEGSDYPAVPRSVVIPANAASVSFSLIPTADTMTEQDETVIVAVDAGNYETDLATGYATGKILASSIGESDPILTQGSTTEMNRLGRDVDRLDATEGQSLQFSNAANDGSGTTLNAIAVVQLTAGREALLLGRDISAHVGSQNTDLTFGSAGAYALKLHYQNTLTGAERTVYVVVFCDFDSGGTKTTTKTKTRRREPTGDLVLISEGAPLDDYLSFARYYYRTHGGYEDMYSVQDAVDKIVAFAIDHDYPFKVIIVDHGSPARISMGEPKSQIVQGSYIKYNDANSYADMVNYTQSLQLLETLGLGTVESVTFLECNVATGNDGKALLKSLADMSNVPQLAFDCSVYWKCSVLGMMFGVPAEFYTDPGDLWRCDPQGQPTPTLLPAWP